LATNRALQKNNFSGSKKLSFPHCSHETQRSSALPKKRLHFSFCALTSKKSYKHGFAKKTTFQALKNCVFSHCSDETQRSSALQKKSGSKKCFCALTSKKSYKHGFAKKQLFRL